MKRQTTPAFSSVIYLVFWPLLFVYVAASAFRSLLLFCLAFVKDDQLELQSAPKLFEAAQKKARLKTLLETATCYAQYEEAARSLDDLEGLHEWKSDPVSEDYDYKLLQERLKQLRFHSNQKRADPIVLGYLLRSTLSRNLGDMGNTRLYGHARIGTKTLIHEYIDEVVKQLDYLADTEFPEFSTTDKLAFFRNIQRSFGTTALLLSGGATFGMIHVGVLKALYEANALPRIISGSSAGSIVAAILCTQPEENFQAALDPHLVNRDFYEDHSEVGNIFPKLYRFMNHGCVFDVEAFIKATKANLGGDITFQEAYNKSRRVLNIAVSSSTRFEMPRLLNYLTAPNVVIWSAVAASCALPLIYRSAPLMYKTNKGTIEAWNPSGHRWIDGSVEGDLPMARISELFDVNHFIVCQVNPHIMPFLNKSLRETWIVRIANDLAYLIRTEGLHRLNQLTELGLTSRSLHRLKSILVQKYSGDITIVPSMSPADYLHIITNPDIELTDHLTLRGEKATWPKIPLIQNHVRIEMCIDKAIYRLKSKQFGSSNTNLASPASQKECGFFESGESSCAESPALDALRATMSRGSLDTLTDLAANLQGREKKRQSLLLRTESAL